MLYSGTTMPKVFKVGDKVRTTKTITPIHNKPSLPIDSEGVIVSAIGFTYQVEFAKYNVTSVVWPDEIELVLPSGRVIVSPTQTRLQDLCNEQREQQEYYNKYVNQITKPKANVCTCGSEKVHGPLTRHSDWCDKKG